MSKQTLKKGEQKMENNIVTIRDFLNSGCEIVKYTTQGPLSTVTFKNEDGEFTHLFDEGELVV